MTVAHTVLGANPSERHTEHVAALAFTQALVDIDLSGNQISVQGIPFLAAGIKASPSLAEVGLDNNDLREVGGQALLDAVQVNGGLVKVRGRAPGAV